MQVLELVPAKLKKWRETLAQGVDDMREDFMMAIKKAIVDFVLRDPSFVESLVADFDSPARREVQEQGPTWRPSIDKAKAKLEKCLYVVNPCLAQLLDLWYSQFR